MVALGEWLCILDRGVRRTSLMLISLSAPWPRGIADLTRQPAACGISLPLAVPLGPGVLARLFEAHLSPRWPWRFDLEAWLVRSRAHP